MATRDGPTRSENLLSSSLRLYCGTKPPIFPGNVNVTPFTLRGLPVDEVSQEMIRSLREIADENGWTIEEVMTMAAEYFAARRQTERELETEDH